MNRDAHIYAYALCMHTRVGKTVQKRGEKNGSLKGKEDVMTRRDQSLLQEMIILGHRLRESYFMIYRFYMFSLIYIAK